MAKTKIKFICSSCGYESLKWLGRCPGCEEWNTFTEELVEVRSGRAKLSDSKAEVLPLVGETLSEDKRIVSGVSEFDRVLGGGIMPGSVVLIGGDPGIGKSTLVMQIAAKLKERVLYVTGEESVNQIRIRAARLKIKSDSLYLLAETDMQIVKSAIEKELPEIVIVDSIQTMAKPELDNAAGTITQIRESTSDLMQIAKEKNIAILLIGHVTKEGYIAGPKILEHMVDTVIQFEGEKNYSYRIMRAQKTVSEVQTRSVF